MKNNRKKICCIFNYPPHYRKAIYELMDRELNCDFYFGENVPGNLKSMDCKILSGFKYKYKNYIIKRKIIWQSGILRLLLKKEYNTYILSVDMASLSEWIFLYLAHLLGKKTYLWTHGWYGKENILSKLKKKAFYYPCTGLLLYSEYAKNLMVKEGIKKEKLYVIANSLDYDQQLQIRNNLTKNKIYNIHFQNRYPTIIFIGRLEVPKKLSNILSAISILEEQNIFINCVFIGEGNDMNHLKKLSEQLNIKDRVWFYGACYDDNKIAQLIYNADICISPGNVGLTAIHSLSFGTPVITHNNFPNQMPEFEAIIENKNGAFFQENNLHSLVMTIKNWLKQHPQKDKEIISECYNSIDTKYNPYYQINIIKRALKL